VSVDVSILVPVYNEEELVDVAIERILAADLGDLSRELIVVDDGSTDRTWAILSALDLPSNVTLLRHPRNLGKGAAVRTALRHADGQWSAIMDADLEYDPEDIQKLLEPLRSGEAEAVFGTRAFESHSAFNFWYVVGNKMLTLAANFIYNAWISDIMTCHKAMATDKFQSLGLRERGFAIEPEITARLLRDGVRIYEVPITYRARGREDGKKLAATDGLRVLRTLIRCRVR
jgi:dolichol-phosphate hexosyltransferase